MERGRFTAYHKMRIQKRRRRIAVPGSFEDKGKYIRCWNCGFIVNVERDLGDTERDGVHIVDSVSGASNPSDSGVSPTLGLDTLSSAGVLLENDSADDAVTDYYTARLPEVISGCPFCGCTNL